MQGTTAERIIERMEALGIDQSELARRVGSSSAAINQIVNGKTRNSRLLPKIAAKLGVSYEFLSGEDNDPLSGQSIAVALDDDVQIDSIDLAYGMGGTYLDTDEFEVEKATFSRKWLRKFTPSSPEHLVSTAGVGDSMWPTIHDRDTVIVDRSQNRFDQGDRIWAVVFGGVGMLKRCRPLPDGSVRIMSDNPQVSDELAADNDLHIVGRVVAIARSV